MRKATHGLSGTSEYIAWRNARRRCLDCKDPAYSRYGARGIKMCDKWLQSPTNFLKDMGHKPTPRHTLDRIDPTGDYTPDNCRWATMTTQQRNKPGLTNIDGKTIGEWCEILNLDKKEKARIYKRHSKYEAKTFDELFCEHLASHRANNRTNRCLCCKTSESSKWRISLCSKCYARALRWSKKTGHSTKSWIEEITRDDVSF